MFTEAQNFSIVQTELDTVFFQSFAYDATDPGIATANSGEIFKPQTTTHAAYIGQINKGVGLFPVIGETQTVPLTTPSVRNKYTVLIKDFAQGIQISKDLYDDNMHGVWAEDVRDLALKARVTQDANAFNLYNNAFTTTLTADGVSFINAAHPLIGGGTTSNLLVGTGLTQATLNAGIIALRTQVDQTNVILGNVPKVLLVPPALFKTAIEITESALITDTSGVANATGNNINVFKNAYGIRVMSSPYLTSSTAWFLLAAQHSVYRIIRQGIETALTPWQYSTNRSYFYQANFRETVYVPDYAGAVAQLL